MQISGYDRLNSQAFNEDRIDNVFGYNAGERNKPDSKAFVLDGQNLDLNIPYDHKNKQKVYQPRPPSQELDINQILRKNQDRLDNIRDINTKEWNEMDAALFDTAVRKQKVGTFGMPTHYEYGPTREQHDLVTTDNELENLLKNQKQHFENINQF